MSVLLKPGLLKGKITIPPSKSIAHRAIIAAALALGESIIDNVDMSKDIEATLGCVKALGAVCSLDNMSLRVNGEKTLLSKTNLPLNCNESGSTLRFMIPIAQLKGDINEFTGAARLFERPLLPYEKIFGLKPGNNTLFTEKPLKSGIFELDGGISSQFVTGLLLALPVLDGDSEIIIKGRLESKPYVELTLFVLKHFGIVVENNGFKHFFIRGGQAYQSRHFFVEGDYSQAAFWLVANALGSDVVCEGLNIDSLQGDREIINIIKDDKNEIDVSEIPDLAPIIAVLCCFKNKKSVITGCGRLRLKECDRLAAIVSEINNLGGNALEGDDSIIINGTGKLAGGTVCAHNDHRIAMAMTIASTRCDNPVLLDNPDCVNKSYPSFYDHYKRCGGNL